MASARLWSRGCEQSYGAEWVSLLGIRSAWPCGMTQNSCLKVLGPMEGCLAEACMAAGIEPTDVLTPDLSVRLGICVNPDHALNYLLV